MKKAINIFTWIFVIIVGYWILHAIFSIPRTIKKTSDSKVSLQQLPSNSNTTAYAAPISSASQQYVTVLTIKGNGTKNSASFHLNGNDAKLIYKYYTDGEVGVFGIWIVNKGVDIMKAGGSPEVMVSKTKVSDESALQKAAGDYYLHINAYGDWKITVEEMQ